MPPMPKRSASRRSSGVRHESGTDWRPSRVKRVKRVNRAPDTHDTRTVPVHADSVRALPGLRLSVAVGLGPLVLPEGRLPGEGGEMSGQIAHLEPWLDKRGLAEHLCCSVRSIQTA